MALGYSATTVYLFTVSKLTPKPPNCLGIGPSNMVDFSAPATDGAEVALIVEGGNGATDDFVHSFRDAELLGANRNDLSEIIRRPAVICRREHHAGALFESEEFLLASPGRNFGRTKFELALETFDFASAPQLGAEGSDTLKFSHVFATPFRQVIDKFVAVVQGLFSCAGNLTTRRNCQRERKSAGSR